MEKLRERSPFPQIKVISFHQNFLHNAPLGECWNHLPTDHAEPIAYPPHAISSSQMMNTWEISRRLREDNTLSRSNRPSMPLLELDEDEMEVFWNYWEQLKEIGVDPTDYDLQETLNGNIRNIEDAILALIQYSSRPGHRWGDKSHPTRFLVKALREGWKPSKPKSSRT